MAILEIAVKAIAEYGLEKILKISGNKVYLFAKEKAITKGIMRQKPSISDKYTTSIGQNMCAFYRNEKHITVSLDSHQYVIPGTLAIEPIDHGVLDRQLIDFEVDCNKYELPESIAPYSGPILTEARNDNRLFDGNVVRFSSLTRVNSNAYKVKLQLASYYDAIATNFAMDHRPKGRSQSLRQFVHEQENSLGDFSSSLLVNHIGVVCMLETADGMLVAQQRSNKVANRSNTISSSASGTLNWSDIAGRDSGSTKLTDIALGCLREIYCELGIAPKDVRFLGVLRDYERGGMPDFYFYAKMSCSLARIIERQKQAEEKYESRKITGFELHSSILNNRLEQSRIAFQKRVRTILDKTSKTANLTFYAGILLTAQFLLELENLGETETGE